jgi:hypothetical protein
MESKPGLIVAASFMGVYADAGVVYPKRIRDFESTESAFPSAPVRWSARPLNNQNLWDFHERLCLQRTSDVVEVALEDN